MRITKVCAMGAALLFLTVTGFAKNEDAKDNSMRAGQELSELRQAIKQLKEQHQKELKKLLARIESLEGAARRTESQSELEQLLQEAKAAEMQQSTPDPKTKTKVFSSGQRQQQSLNPNISVTGDFIGNFSSLDAEEHTDDDHHHGSSGGRQLMLREAEFHIISNLDPYTRAKFFLGIPGHGSFHIGEAYMEWLNLPLNVGLKIGKYRSQLGLLNRWHNHGLPQVDRPRVLTQFLSPGGLSGIGAATNVLLPRLWSHVNELDIEIIYGGDGVSFANAGTRQWVAVGHLKNYYDLTSNTYLEVGVSGAFGHHDVEGEFRTIIGGLDLTYKWVPIGRSKYRAFEFRNELIVSRRETFTNDVTTFGFYSYVENKLDARWRAGVRFDYSQLPESNEENLWGVSPSLTYWQSEFVFLRLQYGHFNMTYGENENVVMLQSVWSLGPHKHEAY